ncbi:MAG TPA: hypothetical protein PKD61_13555 [Polyangiaceae bacterium]|nr:hypothetical protein [Polyangiaceae bacterium]
MNQQKASQELRERRRNAPTEVVLACFRLVKACQIHDDANQTVQQLVPAIGAAVRAYCELFSAETVRIMFSAEVVFVNRRLLRAPRETYAISLQLGELLAQAEANEVVFERGVDEQSALKFCRLVVEAQRSPEAARMLTQTEIRGVVVRHVPEADELEEERKDGPIAKVVKTYAASILILQGFYRDVAAGGTGNTQSVKRIAQKLVALFEQHPELLVAAAAAPLSDASAARRAVSTAVISISMARKLAADRALATSVAQSALLSPLGAVIPGTAAQPSAQAARTLTFVTHTGGLHPPSLRRAVLTHQVLGGDAADSTHALVLAQILRTAARLCDLRAPTEDGARGLGLDAAVEKLQAEFSSATTAPFVRLLVSALGLVVTGTIVELTSGEVAMVTGVPRQALDFTRPKVRLLTDSSHAALATPKEVDLARPKDDEPPRSIKRAIVGAGLSS